MNFIKIVSLFIIFFQGYNTFASEPIKLDSNENMLIGGKYVEIYEDKSEKPDFEIIRQGKVNFQKVTGNFSATQNATSYYWIRFKIDATKNDDRKWVLEILDSRQDEILFYYPDHSGNYVTAQSGMVGGFANRDYTHKNFVFDLTSHPSTNHYYYLRIKSNVISSLLFKIRTVKDFSQYGFNEYYLLGIYYGILAIMSLYSLFLFLTTKEKVYLYYNIYIVLWIYISMIKDGTGFQYIWSDYNSISILGYYLSKPLLMVAFVIYSFEFLSYYPKLKKLIIGLVVFYIVYYSVGLIFNFSPLENIFFHVPLVFICYAAVLNYRAGFKPARYFLLGNSVVLLSLIIVHLRDLGLLEIVLSSNVASIIAVYITNICMVIEIILLSFAMADRFRFLKIEKEKTQILLIQQYKENQEMSEKVNKELEMKVKDRTLALEEKSRLLEEANHKLSEQAEKINQMNASLDLDNWNLKKNLKNEKELRIHQADISIEEFMQVFPNEVAIFKYLEDQKWANGYSCLNCGNTKYGKGTNVFSRRCTKCRHGETVTANTIFNNTKFQLTKALYIVATVNKYGEKTAIKDLSQKLQLRYATCWSFVKKVQEAQTQNDYSKLSPDKKLPFLIFGRVAINS